MPNQFHLRANIDRLWRRSADHNPGYVRVAALDAIVREIFAPNDRARANYQLYLATDPFDVARHKLRDLYDHHIEVAPAQAGASPALDAERAGVRSPHWRKNNPRKRRPLVTTPAQHCLFFFFESTDHLAPPCPQRDRKLPRQHEAD